MFTYAFTRSLLVSDEVKDKRLIFNFKRSIGGGKAKDGFEDSLRYFHVAEYCVVSHDLILKYGSFLQRIVYLFYMLCTHIAIINNNDAIMSSLDKIAERFGIYYTGAADKAPIITNINHRHLFVRGYFADKNNFDSIRPILLKEFTPIELPLLKNEAIYKAAAQPNSVCVSVRRGDYLSDIYKKDFFVCDEQYFNKAIKHISEKIDNPVFIFFSNDITWVRDHLNVDHHPCYYESGDDPVWEVLRMMYSCHHFIISNSTFSWWAQYLGRRDDKIVISPSRWFANPLWSSNLIDEQFILIDS